MPRKTKTTSNETQPSTARRPAATTDKTGTKRASAKSAPAKKPAAARKSAPRAKKETPSKGARRIEPSEEAIRIRAYFIAERRHRLALPGDANNDWIEARRQLAAETNPAA